MTGGTDGGAAIRCLMLSGVCVDLRRSPVPGDNTWRHTASRNDHTAGNGHTQQVIFSKNCFFRKINSRYRHRRTETLSCVERSVRRPLTVACPRQQDVAAHHQQPCSPFSERSVRGQGGNLTRHKNDWWYRRRRRDTLPHAEWCVRRP